MDGRTDGRTDGCVARDTCVLAVPPMGSTFPARSKTRRIYQYSHSCKIFNFLRQAHANTRLNDLVSHKHLLKFHKDMQVKGHVCLETARAKRMCWYSWFRTSFMLGLSHTSTSPSPSPFVRTGKSSTSAELPRVAPQKMQKGLHAKELWAAVRDPAYAPL